ncbi:hypothetical protein ACJMK2_039555, partial [Sinanodonta woodiana]
PILKDHLFCPKHMVSEDRWSLITNIYHIFQGQEYTEEFLLEYQREDTGEWMRFHNKTGEEIFKGNENTYLAELREVRPPIIARRVRFIPYSQHPRTVCLRVELYGCVWEDGLVSYSMRQGDKRGTEVDFFDFTYDGIIQDGFLRNGLGQLTDGEIGETNFRIDQQQLGIRGYEWVGWRNDSSKEPLQIVFKFDTVRNFSSVIFNSNNYFSKDVSVFRKAIIYLSIGGIYYTAQPVIFNYVRDTVVEFSRPIKINLLNQIGRFVKVHLYFDSRWILISEVNFKSEPAYGNFTEETPPPTESPPVVTPKIVSGENTQDFHKIDVDPGGDEEDAKHETPNHQIKKSSNDDHIAIIIGCLAALTVILLVVGIFICARHRRQKLQRQNLKPTAENHVNIHLNHLNGHTGEKIVNGNLYNGIAMEEPDMDKELLNESQDYAIPDVTKSALHVEIPPQTLMRGQQNGLIALDHPPTYDALYAAADVINSQVPNIPSLQGVSGNSVYSMPNADLLLSLDVPVVQFPRENLRFIEMLGEGQFGEVHLSEALHISNYLEEDLFPNRTVSRPMLVAVKILRKGADDKAKRDFQKEIKIMSQLKDPNIVRVLGVCTEEEPFCMIVEYMKYGDLNQFLLDHDPEDIEDPNSTGKVLSYGCLIYMATQIASGMKYLESLNMVHRDLATRNCLVGTNFTIKISDFGMSRSLYSADYYRIEGRAVLPIRWMAWESILLGKFTTKSDVWSFAVTLWEILTFARQQPFINLTDDQVIENAGHYYRNDNQQVYLPQPPDIPKEIFDLMLECWNRQESVRPTFKEIHMFLQRKNMGYNPKEEKLMQIKVAIC